MSEDIKQDVQVDEEQQAAPEVSLDTIKQENEELKASMERILAKNNELLGETKKAKQEDRERARQNGEYEKLLGIVEEEKNKATAELQQYKQKIVDQNLNSTAMKLAQELKAVPESSELLAHFVSEELKKVADAEGKVSDVALEAIKHSFGNEAKYQPLLMGNQSTGGGASSVQGSAPKAKQVSRAEFDRMDSVKKMSFIKNGGSLI